MLSALVDNPHRVGGRLQRELAGLHSARRVADPVIYEIDDDQHTVIVLRFDHRCGRASADRHAYRSPSKPADPSEIVTDRSAVDRSVLSHSRGTGTLRHAPHRRRSVEGSASPVRRHRRSHVVVASGVPHAADNRSQHRLLSALHRRRGEPSKTHVSSGHGTIVRSRNFRIPS